MLAPALAVSALAALAPAVGPAAASAAPTAASDGSGAAGGALPQALARQTPEWKPCEIPGVPASARCATLTVPLDYRDPGGRTIEVEISRRQATDPDRRRGVLLLNPGGPGGPGLEMPFDPGLKLPDSVTSRYDVIGFDPRGMGRSNSLACGLTGAELEPERPYRPGRFAADVAATRSFAEKCRAKYGDAIAQFTTRNTARDMDLIRSALGERKISYLGFSYGTYLGAVYTQMFPQRADRFVLDSAVDANRVWREDIRRYGPEGEKTLAHWARWTAERSADYGLGDTPAEVSRTFWKIVEQAEREPIRIGSRTYDADQLRLMARMNTYSAQGLAEAVVLMKKGAEGKPSGDLPGFDAAWEDGEQTKFWTINCNDSAWPRDPSVYARDAARDKKRYPFFGDYASNITPCAFWKPPVEPPTQVRNDTRALILQNEWDHATPLPGAHELRAALRNSRLAVVAGGEGHGIYALGRNRCADELATAYLAEGRYPSADVTCAADAGGKGRIPIPGSPIGG
ncbi:alpha/beta fold hydrolase [Streptomyces clavuligerus]|nr:hydrolase [Streptomyces clavuligerus]AXU14397.1 alpha/beta hydrolase [Streptomyces clavuligerus]EDY48361.1 secreted hydrolase [Streptomyces clavuligerus]MBY6304404.1 alpha/beta fold hydrolase [Streptomyces clavuligerus]QCS07171.1 alpha/beta hydrolase [Streptomyces clavuligerus]